MMDGRNCMSITSLLNDSSDGSRAKADLPPLSLHLRATSSSCDSTPSLSPQTPVLSRSSSSDSRAFSTPSPLSPAWSTFDQAAHHHQLTSRSHASHHSQHQQRYYLHHNSHAFAKMDDHNASMYPPIPDVTGGMPQAYPMPPHIAPQLPQQQQQQQQAPPQQQQQQLHQQPQQLQPQILQPQPQQNNQVFRTSDSPASEPSRVSAASAQSNQKPQKKNHYPCPMAKQVGCTDFFTTSGHAARHAKKHTGKKDAFCPECNKAFTRKDNMEQHRRTHQNGRGASRASNDDSKVKKTTKALPKKASVKSEPALEAAVEQQLAEQAQAVQAQQAVQAIEQSQVQGHAQQIPQQLPMDQVMLAASGPYFLNTIDSGPIPSLPLAMPDLNARPPLHRASFASSLDYVPPTAPMVDPETLHYSYPSPGLSNGLNSLALAASEHARMLEKSQSRSPSQETPDQHLP